MLYFAFDLLWLDSRDLRKEPQIERKRLLRELMEEHGLKEPVLYSEHHEGDGQALFAAASRLNYEGIVSKRVDAPYRSDRVDAWQKIKVVQKGKFPVVGFIKDPSGVAALYLGRKEGKDLVYMGKVGTGWSRTTSAQIRKALDTVVSPKQKLTKTIRKHRRCRNDCAGHCADFWNNIFSLYWCVVCGMVVEEDAPANGRRRPSFGRSHLHRSWRAGTPSQPVKRS